MTAGYSSTPLWKKLGLRDGMTVAALDAPAHLDELLHDRPVGIEFRTSARGRPDLSLLFCADRAALRRRRSQLGRLAHPDRAVWICWPKKKSPFFVDLTEDDIRTEILGGPDGLVDVKVCAVDDDWSGLKLMIRRDRR